MEFNRNLKSLDNKTGEKIKKQIARMMENHDQYKKCYFWSNTGNAASRRKQEFTDSLIFMLDGVVYEWFQELQISCRNFYWTSKIYKGGHKTNISAMKKLI